MPIQGLSTQPARFVEIGRLSKGEEKPDGRPGKDLDHFRFRKADAAAMDAFESAYPTNAHKRQINIFLPYPAAGENLTAFRELRNKVGLLHRCDGYHVWEYDKRSGQLVETIKPCPTIDLPDVTPDKRGNMAKNPAKCHPVARLSVIIPELQRFGYVLFTVTSKNDIVSLSREIAAIEGMTGHCDGIPMILTRRKESISSPTSEGGRAMIDRYMCHVEIAPDYAAVHLIGMRESAMIEASGMRNLAAPAPARLALPAPAPRNDRAELLRDIDRVAIKHHGPDALANIDDDDDDAGWEEDEDDQPGAIYAAPVAEPTKAPAKAAAPQVEAEPLWTPQQIKDAWRDLQAAGANVSQARWAKLWAMDLANLDDPRTRDTMAWIRAEQAKIDKAKK